MAEPAIVFAKKITTSASPALLRRTVTEGLTSSGINIDQFFSRQNVLIKPNLCGQGNGHRTFYSMTARDLIVTLVNIAQDGGASRIAVGDNPAGYVQNPREFLESIGMLELARQHNFTFLNLRELHFNANIPLSRSIRLSSALDDYQIIINTALPKVHNQSDGVTLCLKNLAMGCVNDRNAVHELGLHQGIAQINQVIRQGQGRTVIDILDGRRGQQGIGPHFGEEIDPGWMLITRGNPAGLDACAARLMGFDPRGIRHIYLSAGAGLGTIDPYTIGDQIQPTPFDPARESSFCLLPEDRGIAVFWMDDNWVGHYRIIAGDQAKEMSLHFNDDRLSLEEAERWVYTPENQTRLLEFSSRYDGRRYIINPPIRFLTPPSAKVNRSFWQKHFGLAELRQIANEIQRAATRGSFILRPTENGLAYDNTFMNSEDYACNRQELIPGSRSLAQRLIAAGSPQIYVQRNSTWADFNALDQEL